MKSFFYKVLRFLYANSKWIQKIYRNITQHISFTTDIPETTPILARPLAELKDEIRINLMAPTINKDQVFGGMATALKIFNRLSNAMNAKRRIIITDSQPDKNDLEGYPDYHVTTSDEDSSQDFQISVFASRQKKTIPVGKNDLFVMTGWWTAYNTYPVMEWQAVYYNSPIHPCIYLIQDFEPGFYAWSSRYVLAESTYNDKYNQIALFNTSILKTFFNNNGYHFYKEYYFEPTLNTILKKYLESNADQMRTTQRKKQIIFYGRHTVARNAFEIILKGLRIWASKQPDIEEWSVISVGEKHNDVNIGNGMIVRSLGKLTIEGYAKLMAESFAGISLMISPHPSYPPLEMSVFGVKTITNSYANKDLSKFNKNIVSLKEVTPARLSDELLNICLSYPASADIYIQGDYFDGDGNLDNAVDRIVMDVQDSLKKNEA